MITLAFYAAVGIGYFVFAHYMKRRQFWAVVAALSLTGVIALVMVASAALQLVAMAMARRPVPRQFLISLLGVEGLILLALAQLIYHLAKSFEAIKHVAPDEGRGFDVLPAAVLATEPAIERFPTALAPGAADEGAPDADRPA